RTDGLATMRKLGDAAGFEVEHEELLEQYQRSGEHGLRLPEHAAVAHHERSVDLGDDFGVAPLEGDRKQLGWLPHRAPGRPVSAAVGGRKLVLGKRGVV